MIALLRGAAFATALGLALPAMPVPAAAASEAESFVADLGEEAVRILQPERSAAERAEALEELLRKAFDLELVGRAVLGRHWNQASAEQKAAYSEAFADYIVQTYARRLAEHVVSGFDITGSRPAGERDTLVATVIRLPDAPPLNYGWRVRRTEQGPRLIDVVVEGVSLTVTHRADFTSAVQQQGLDGLIETLRRRVS